ncbi:flagellin [Oxalobacter vibrioformis]|uniref:Flagellin n=1 Tax=Oxalobacter vibrioformis TaxID=933080 RepID=A0A9E9LWJ1_9BURK|nr:flagellin [Oxalobacter vibrioformis]WAW09581.1 flagellin [Oxalobacter vibrioformis]
MPITLTNIAGMSAQRHLNAAQSRASTALERLSSGKRINSAKDDPAGFAIASRMTSQINGMNQSIRNANDGISFAQTAEGALGTTADMLQRVRVLALQASNTTNIWDRQAIQEEVTQLIAEINRSAETLTFNGMKIFDGSCGSMTYQVGPNAGDTLTYASANMLTRHYGTYRVSQSTPGVGAASNVTGGDITISGSQGSATYTAAAGASARAIASGINAMSARTGVTATAKTDVNLIPASGANTTFELTADNGKAIVISFSTANTGNATDDLAAAVNAINAQAGKTGVTAQADRQNGGIRLTHNKGSDITITNTNTSDTAAITMSNYGPDSKPGAATTLANSQTGVANGAITYDSPYGFIVTDNSGLMSNGGSTAVARLHSVSAIDVTSFDGAQLAISIIDSALTTVNRERSRYGAMQNRFGYIIDNLAISAENLSNAKSRIEDADYAAETAALAKASLLMQATTAMIAQANQINRNLILTLLDSMRRH